MWIDHLPRRPIMIVSDWGRAASLGSIPLAYFLDMLALGQLYVVSLIADTLTMFFDVTFPKAVCRC